MRLYPTKNVKHCSNCNALGLCPREMKFVAAKAYVIPTVLHMRRLRSKHHGRGVCVVSKVLTCTAQRDQLLKPEH